MSRWGPAGVHVTIHARSDANGTFTNQPLADTFLFNSDRHVVMVDITNMHQCQLKVNKQSTAANAGAILTLRYSGVYSTSVASYVDLGDTPCTVAIDVQNTYLSSGWIDLNNDCLGYEEIYLAVIGTGGNGVLDPAFGSISASFV